MSSSSAAKVSAPMVASSKDWTTVGQVNSKVSQRVSNLGEASIQARAARVNASLAGKSLKPKSDKACFAYFGSGCDRDNCGFSHDEDRYKTERGLKDCPNEDCDNYCKETSKQCSACVNKLWEARSQERSARQAEIDAREAKPCKGFECMATTKMGAFCRSCWEINKRYVVDRRPRDDK